MWGYVGRLSVGDGQGGGKWEEWKLLNAKNNHEGCSIDHAADVYAEAGCHHRGRDWVTAVVSADPGLP